MNVVDAAPNIISDVVDLEGDALLKTDKSTRSLTDLAGDLFWFPQIFVESLAQERLVLIHHFQQVFKLLQSPANLSCFT